MENHQRTVMHPYDTPVSAGLRFLSELIAWVAGPWALAQFSVWLAVPAVFVLVGLPSVFSTKKDKHNVIVPTPGPVRMMIELLLYLVAAIAPWFVWSAPYAGIATGIIVGSLGFGFPRLLWLAKGAP
jgi:hypothetical protein